MVKEEKKQPPPGEQVSYEEILNRRAIKLRDLELWEQRALALDELKFQQQELANNRQEEQQQTTQFAAELKALKEGPEADGRELVRRTLKQSSRNRRRSNCW